MILFSLTNIFHLIPLIHYIQASNIADQQILDAKIDPNYNKTWMYFPDGNGAIFNISLKPINKFTKKQSKLLDAKAFFWLYTKQNVRKPIELKKTGKQNLTEFELTDKFNRKIPIKFLIHGWRANRDHPSVKEARSAYLEKTRKYYNIIVVDWEDAAKDIRYYPAAYATRTIGQFVAHVINHMRIHHDVNLKDVHIIGHSLGAHVAGVAGYVIESLSGQKVGRITGTDPAYPRFENTSKKKLMLDSSDAEFVDVIHSCGGMLGHSSSLGHADFFPNGGAIVQPGCDYLINDFYGACSHEKAAEYFAETINYPKQHMAQQCLSWKSFKENECKSPKIPMGDAVPRNANGQYYLRTNESK